MDKAALALGNAFLDGQRRAEEDQNPDQRFASRWAQANGHMENSDMWRCYVAGYCSAVEPSRHRR